MQTQDLDSSSLCSDETLCLYAVALKEMCQKCFDGENWNGRLSMSLYSLNTLKVKLIFAGQIGEVKYIGLHYETEPWIYHITTITYADTLTYFGAGYVLDKRSASLKATPVDPSDLLENDKNSVALSLRRTQ